MKRMKSGYYDFTNLSIDEDKLNDISIDDLNNHTVFDTLTKWQIAYLKVFIQQNF